MTYSENLVTCKMRIFNVDMLPTYRTSYMGETLTEESFKCADHFKAGGSTINIKVIKNRACWVMGA
jgi:hypothetical protein